MIWSTLPRKDLTHGPFIPVVMIAGDLDHFYSGENAQKSIGVY